jgi:hypothetical protein
MYRVVFPLELRLSNTTSDAVGADALYSLTAVVVHVGSGPHHGWWAFVCACCLRCLLFVSGCVSGRCGGGVVSSWLQPLPVALLPARVACDLRSHERVFLPLGVQDEDSNREKLIS